MSSIMIIFLILIFFVLFYSLIERSVSGMVKGIRFNNIIQTNKYQSHRVCITEVPLYIIQTSTNPIGSV